MAKRIRNFRKHQSQRVFAAIVHTSTEAKIAESIKTGIAIDAETAQRAVEDGRDPFEMARAAGDALRSTK